MHRTIGDFVLDIVQNSIEARASLVVLDLIESPGQLQVFVADNGCGMEEAELERARDPFYSNGTKHADRKAGLGIPFLLQAVEQAGGEAQIDSRKGEGTSVSFTFALDHIDTPPVGDVPACFAALLTYPGEYELVINRSYRPADAGEGGENRYTITRSELREALGEFETAGALALLRDYLRSQETDQADTVRNVT
jgi:hypothetical protein